MENKLIADRLRGMQTQLKAVYDGGISMASAAKGSEREEFMDIFLSRVLPLPFRFGTGQITDKCGAASGQLDIVVEYPFLPSLPLVGGSRSRLYLAESAAAVIEVKSDVAGQWDEVIGTANKLAKVKRRFGRVRKRMVGLSVDGMTREIPDHIDRVPIFAVGYTGWKTFDTIKEKLQEHRDENNLPLVDGILVIDSGLFHCTSRFGGWLADQEASLWGLISCLEMATRDIVSMGANSLHYAKAYQD